MRPVIGITASYSQSIHVHEIDEPRLEHQYCYNDYVHAVWMAGGLPLLIPAMLDASGAAEYVKRLNGIVIAGGPDIDPKQYHQPAGPNQTRIDIRKDETELAVARAAIDRWMPVLGICRGLQVLAVALGGNLIQDIATELPWAARHGYPEGDPDAWHEVKFESGSSLKRIIGAENATVNTYHHQAVGEVPADWKVTAKAPDGVIEGMEFSDEPLVFGVQWHPEMMVASHPEQLRLFRAFVKSCG